MTLKRIMPQETTQEDYTNLTRACAASYCGYGPDDITQAVLGGGMQLWRWAEGGIIVTRLEHYPAGKQLYVLVLAGKGLIDNLESVWETLQGFARVERCRWIAGATEIEKLGFTFAGLGATKRFEYLVFDVEPSCGLAHDTPVMTPEGDVAIGALRPGDMVSGPDGTQRIVRVACVSGRVYGDGMAPGTMVKGPMGSWRKRADMDAHHDSLHDATIVELTVEPDHEFMLADSTIVHNKGGGGGQPSKTTQVTKPWWGQREALLNVYDEADSAREQAGDLAAAGPQIDDITQGYMNAADTAAIGMGQVRQLGLDSLEGKYLNPASNPYLGAAINSSQQNVIDQFQRSTMPALGDAAASAGAYGGSRQGVLEGLATQGLADSLGDISTRMTYQNYNAERQNQLGAAGLLGQANELALAPTQYLQQGYQIGQQLPYTSAQTYGGIVNSTPTFSTSTGTQQQARPSGVGGAIQGGLGGAATGASIGSVVPGVGTGIGAAVGGGLGAIGSFF